MQERVGREWMIQTHLKTGNGKPHGGIKIPLCRIFENKIIQRKGRDDGMAAFFIEFSKELIELIILAGVSVAAIFCGKKLRDRKDAKTASEQKSN